MNLPVLNNDAIRTEIIEDEGRFNERKYIEQRNQRLDNILENGFSFILDASVDREWQELQKRLTKFDYSWFIISLDLPRSFVERLYQIKGYTESLNRLDKLLLDHEMFLKTHSEDIGLYIKDSTFSDRLELSYNAIKKHLETL